MISNLELRQIIESGFLPMKCICDVENPIRITVRLYDPGTGRQAFISDQIALSELATIRDISDMVAMLKQQLAQQGQEHLAVQLRTKG